MHMVNDAFLHRPQRCSAMQCSYREEPTSGRSLLEGNPELKAPCLPRHTAVGGLRARNCERSPTREKGCMNKLLACLGHCRC